MLLDPNISQFTSGLKAFSAMISKHVGASDLSRHIREILKYLVSSDSFQEKNGEYLSPVNALELIESMIYLEILYEEYLRHSGRRGFFIANYKNVEPKWSYFALEMSLCKSFNYSVKDLLALSSGLKSDRLNIISKWSKDERFAVYVILSNRKQIGIFQDGSFIGFKDYKKINSVEDILQILFDEINLLIGFFIKKEGDYFELYSSVPPVQSISSRREKEKTTHSHVPASPAVTENLLAKNLKILNLTKLPLSKKELKKVFFSFAQKVHPDKFEHIDKGTRTEIAIVDKFREIHAAYEFIEKEIEKAE